MNFEKNKKQDLYKRFYKNLKKKKTFLESSSGFNLPLLWYPRRCISPLQLWYVVFVPRLSLSLFHRSALGLYPEESLCRGGERSSEERFDTMMIGTRNQRECSPLPLRSEATAFARRRRLSFPYAKILIEEKKRENLEKDVKGWRRKIGVNSSFSFYNLPLTLATRPFR